MGATMKQTTAFNNLIPNALPNLQNDCAMSYSSTTSSISIWMVSSSGHSQNANGVGLPCFQYPDGTLNYPTAANCGSSGTPLQAFGSLTSGASYWILARYSPSAKTFTANIYTTQAAAISAQNAYTGDGAAFGVSTSADTSASITATSGTGSRGGGAGGGGGRPLQ